MKKHKGKELRLLRKLGKKYKADVVEDEEMKRQRMKQEYWDRQQAEKKERKRKARERMEEEAKSNFAEEVDPDKAKATDSGGRNVQFEEDEEDEVIDLTDDDENDSGTKAEETKQEL